MMMMMMMIIIIICETKLFCQDLTNSVYTQLARTMCELRKLARVIKYEHRYLTVNSPRII